MRAVQGLATLTLTQDRIPQGMFAVDTGLLWGS